MMRKLEHLIGLRNLSKDDICTILDIAESLEDVCTGKILSHELENKMMATFFYEPSTRTRFSFEAAMQRLGGKVISMADAKSTSSVWKGEDLSDTIRTIHNYADVIVLRHPEAGAAEKASKYSRVPILNAGDGTNEHPTQALLDILTIRREKGTIDGLNIVIVGDLKHTRSTNSLTLGLSNFDVNLKLVAPKGFETDKAIINLLEDRGTHFEQSDDIRTFIKQADVVYVCRIQKERLESASDFELIKGGYAVNRKILEESPKVISVLHHMPRVDELSKDVDDYPGAAYFKQPFNGILIRAAVLKLVMNPEDF